MLTRLSPLVLLAGLVTGCDSAAPITADVATLEVRVIHGAQVQIFDLDAGDASDAVGGIGQQGQTRTLSLSASVVITGGPSAVVSLDLPIGDVDLEPGRRYDADDAGGRIAYDAEDGAVRTTLQVEVTEATVVLRHVTPHRLAGTFTAEGTDGQGRTVEARGSFDGRRFDVPR